MDDNLVEIDVLDKFSTSKDIDSLSLIERKYAFEQLADKLPDISSIHFDSFYNGTIYMGDLSSFDSTAPELNEILLKKIITMGAWLCKRSLEQHTSHNDFSNPSDISSNNWIIKPIVDEIASVGIFRKKKSRYTGGDVVARFKPFGMRVVARKYIDIVQKPVVKGTEMNSTRPVLNTNTDLKVRFELPVKCETQGGLNYITAGIDEENRILGVTTKPLDKVLAAAAYFIVETPSSSTTDYVGIHQNYRNMINFLTSDVQFMIQHTINRELSDNNVVNQLPFRESVMTSGVSKVPTGLVAKLEKTQYKFTLNELFAANAPYAFYSLGLYELYSIILCRGSESKLAIETLNKIMVRSSRASKNRKIRADALVSEYIANTLKMYVEILLGETQLKIFESELDKQMPKLSGLDVLKVLPAGLRRVVMAEYELRKRQYDANE
jgi:hypothetical protein